MKKILVFLGAVLLMSSCVEGNLYDLYDDDIVLFKNIKRNKFGNDAYFIPNSLFNTSGCAYKAIKFVFGDRFSLNTIQSAMSEYDDDLENFPKEYIVDVVNDLTGTTVGTKSAPLSIGEIRVNDIICVPPIEYNGQYMTTGHATVVTNINNGLFATSVDCYDSCHFYISYISLVIQTSSLN